MYGSTNGNTYCKQSMVAKIVAKRDWVKMMVRNLHKLKQKELKVRASAGKSSVTLPLTGIMSLQLSCIIDISTESIISMVASSIHQARPSRTISGPATSDLVSSGFFSVHRPCILEQ